MENVKKIILSISLLLGLVCQVQSQEFKRNIEFKTFVPKGQWIVGSSLSYSEHNEKNYQFLIVEGLNSDGYRFNVSPMFSYAFKDNMTVGARILYGRSLFKLDDVSVVIDDQTNLDLSGLYELQHSYSGLATLRNYISLGNSKRFALFNETRLGFGGSRAKILNRSTGKNTGTYKTSTDISFGIAPGIVAFVNNIMAVEVNIGVLGLEFNRVKQIHDQVETSERTSSFANFKINLFSIEMGIAFYL